ncbi:uncharacterized protein LOC127835420 isoform X2 [Dreissena polymorpha]|uniref:uncharacterized protein LOC127835420 isoform X2 n=1 Tax=Dreissena polymorpha TaxID=45954 RepID=UPI0022647F0D|nr:uncharacterized protein LOC127835420 isoform X2 [Dreissena polymorpha]
MATNEQEAQQEVSSDMIGECIVINLCQPCTRKRTPSKATVFCKTCNEHLCEPCKKSHIIYKSGKHDTVIIENLNSAPAVVKMKGMDKCLDHDKNIKFICEDHSKLCCNTCMFIHRKCDNVNELASLSSQEGLELQDLNNTLLKLETETGSIIADCKLSEDALIETIAHIPKQLDKMKDRIIEIFDKAKSKMIAEAENFKAGEMNRLGERTNATLKVNEDINELLPVSSALVKHGTPEQKYIISHIMKEKIKYIETHITEQRNKHSTSNVALIFSKQLSSLLKEEEGIVKLNAERHLTYTDVVNTSQPIVPASSDIYARTTDSNKDVVQTSPTKMQESSKVMKKTTVLNKDIVQTSPMRIQDSSKVKKETTVTAVNKDVVQTSPMRIQDSSNVKRETTVTAVNKGCSSDSAKSARI